MDAHANFARSTVATAPSPASSGTSLVVQSGDGALFPTAPFNATVWPAGSQPTSVNAEIVRVTAKSTDTFTIARAQESTSARTIVVGDQIAATVTKKTLTDIEPPAVQSVSSSSTPTPDMGSAGQGPILFEVSALAANPTFGAPTGTPVDGQKLIIQIKDNGTPRTLAWNAAYVRGASALPTTTVASKILTLGFMYTTMNSLNKYRLIAVDQEV